MHVATVVERRSPPPRMTARRGFSFLEMLVVLGILAALTLVAVQSLEPLAEQSRYEMTKRTLDDVRSAIIAVNQVDGASLASGLAADTSLLPDLTSAPAFYNCLTVGAGMPASATYSINGLSSTYGWRGPYLQGALTSTQFVDGWNTPLSVWIQDAGGNVKSNFTDLSDRLFISNISPTTTTKRLASATITGNQLSATQLTVNMYGLDLTGNRISLTGANSPLASLPEVYLQGGLDPVTKVVTTITGTAAVNGTGCTCQFTPPLPQLLVGVRTLSVVTTLSDAEHYEAYSPTTQVNLLPGTSPIIELLVVRQTSAAAAASGGGEAGAGGGEGM